MSRLFVIGNGFDRAPGLKTSYEDLHDFLRSQYDVTDEEDMFIWMDICTRTKMESWIAMMWPRDS